MTYISLLEKLKILFNTLIEFKLVLVFVILMVILTLIYILKKINNKKYLLSMALLFVLLFTISIITNHKILFNTFDNFTTIFFRNIYFPSIYVYITLLVFIDIVFIISIAGKKIKKSYKITNSIMFVLNNIIFATILNFIAHNKIDIFEISSLYTSTDLVAILELNMNLAILWFFVIVIIYITNTICDRVKDRKTVKEPSNTLIEELSNSIVGEITNKKYNNLDNPTLAHEKHNNNDLIPNTLIINNEDNKVESTFDNIINGNIKATYYEVEDRNTPIITVANPQEIYESKYHNMLSEIENQKNLDNIIEDNKISTLEETSNNIINIKNTFEEKVSQVKESTIDNSTLNVLKESSIDNNTINSQNISEENISSVQEKIFDNIKVENSEDILKTEDTILNTACGKEQKNTIVGNYTIEEYKKMIKMLKELKNYTRYSNISIDDAVAISLISKYSFDDCRKFKELIESNLN